MIDEDTGAWWFAMAMLAVVILIALLIVWSAKNDTKRAEAITLYEKCVMEEYGMTPLQYKKDTGEMPQCKK